MPYTDHNQRHENDSPVIPKDINEYLQDRLSVCATDRIRKILDGEKEGQQNKQAEDCGDANRGYDTQGSAPRGIVGLLGKMGGSVEASKGVLAHERPTSRDVSRRSANAPSYTTSRTSAIVEGGEDELRTLMGRRLGKDSDRQRKNTKTMEGNGVVVEKAESVHPEAVDDPVRYENGRVYSDRFAGRGRIARLDRRGCGDQSSQTKRYTRRDSDLTEEVEPAGDPRSEGGMLGRRQHGRPEVWPTTRWDRRDDLSHAQGHDEGEEADNDPSHRHSTWAAGVEAIFK